MNIDGGGGGGGSARGAAVVEEAPLPPGGSIVFDMVLDGFPHVTWKISVHLDQWCFLNEGLQADAVLLMEYLLVQSVGKLNSNIKKKRHGTFVDKNIEKGDLLDAFVAAGEGSVRVVDINKDLFDLIVSETKVAEENVEGAGPSPWAPRPLTFICRNTKVLCWSIRFNVRDQGKFKLKGMKNGASHDGFDTTETARAAATEGIGLNDASDAYEAICRLKHAKRTGVTPEVLKAHHMAAATATEAAKKSLGPVLYRPVYAPPEATPTIPIDEVQEQSQAAFNADGSTSVRATDGIPEDVVKFEIPVAKLEKGDKIGAGHFSTVFAATLQIGDESLDVAAKEGDECLKEIELMAKIAPSPHVLGLVGFTRVDTVYTLVTVRCRGSLTDILHNHAIESSVAHPNALHYLIGALKGMEWLLGHHQILHKDVHGGNVFIDVLNNAKLADLGLSREGQAATVPSENGEVVYTSTKGGSLVATAWCAPSAFFGKFSPDTDVWAWACMAVDTYLNGQGPYSGFPSGTVENLRHTVQNGMRPAIPYLMPKAVANVVMPCFRRGADCPKVATLITRLEALDNAAIPPV